MANLKSIRQQIEKLEAEKLHVEAAIPPASVLEHRLRDHLALLQKPAEEFVNNCATALAGGGFSDLVPYTTGGLAQAAFSLNLTSARIDEIVEAAKLQAAEENTGCLRLTDGEKAERLHTIKCDLYQLGLDEEAALDGAPRRPNASAACVMGIPLADAINFEIF